MFVLHFYHQILEYKSKLLEERQDKEIKGLLNLY
jgi:hypothetical protein